MLSVKIDRDNKCGIALSIKFSSFKAKNSPFYDLNTAKSISAMNSFV